MQKLFIGEHEKSNDYESTLVQMKAFIFYCSLLGFKFLTCSKWNLMKTC
jgi:hypothetical protein